MYGVLQHTMLSSSYYGIWQVQWCHTEWVQAVVGARRGALSQQYCCLNGAACSAASVKICHIPTWVVDLSHSHANHRATYRLHTHLDVPGWQCALLHTHQEFAPFTCAERSGCNFVRRSTVVVVLSTAGEAVYWHIAVAAFKFGAWCGCCCWPHVLSDMRTVTNDVPLDKRLPAIPAQDS
jgi:hypothetical protein